MKKMRYLFLAILFLNSNYSEAQNIKSFPVEMTYRKMPTELLPSNYQFYSTSIAIDPGFMRSVSLSETIIDGLINIGGFKKISKGGNFFIEVIIDQPLNAPSAITIESKVQKSKKKDGTPVSTKFFWWQHKIQLPIAVRVLDMNNEVLIDEIIRQGATIQLVKGKETTTYEAAIKLREKADKNVKSVYYSEIEKGVKAANDLINKKYGFPITRANPGLGILAAKKHPNYNSWQTQMETAKLAYAELKGDQNTDQFKADIQPVMEFWKAEYNANDKTDKKQRKIWYQSAVNLMNTSYWMEDFDAANSYANEIAGQKFKKVAGELMIKNIESTKKRMSAINATTRYFPIEFGDPSNELLNIVYHGERQAKINAYKDRAMGIDEGTKEYSGSITTTQGQEFPVTFVIDYSKSLWLDFEAYGNVKFFREGETFVQRHYLDVAKIKAFTFDNRLFRLMEFKPASAVKIAARKTVPAQYLEVIYETDQIGVYHFYPNKQSRSQLGEQIDELVLRKGPAGADLISMGGLKYLVLKKGLSKLFAECESLLKSIEAGNFKRTDESLKQLAIQYENDCLK